MALLRGRQNRVKGVVVEKRSKVREPGGGQSDQWVPQGGPVPCRVMPLSVQESYQFQTLGLRVSHLVRFEEDPGLTSEYRLRLGGRVLEFRGVMNPQEADRFWDVMAEEVGAATANPGG